MYKMMGRFNKNTKTIFLDVLAWAATETSETLKLAFCELQEQRKCRSGAAKLRTVSRGRRREVVRHFFSLRKFKCLLSWWRAGRLSTQQWILISHFFTQHKVSTHQTNKHQMWLYLRAVSIRNSRGNVNGHNHTSDHQNVYRLRHKGRAS